MQVFRVTTGTEADRCRRDRRAVTSKPCRRRRKRMTYLVRQEARIKVKAARLWSDEEHPVDKERAAQP